MLVRNPSPSTPLAVVTRVPGASRALQLAQQGWYCERGFFDQDDVLALRAAVDAAFDAPALSASVLSPPGCGSILPDLFRVPEIYRRLFTPRTAALLRELIGPGFVLLPEHAAHRNGFGGWHKDTNMFEDAGLMDHWSNDYAIYQGAIYLQDNTAEGGGGLSVVPGSHRVPRPSARLADAAQRFQAHAQQHGVLLDSGAGDLIVFHTRLDHRATPKSGLPPYGAKRALFFMAARDNHHAAAYCEFIHRRKDYTYLQGYRIPTDMQALARNHGFRFAE
jgi:hypothetical protein